MILIASGAYIEDEFSAEVGLLPPSFLPIGNKRLYEYQVEFLRATKSFQGDLYLSVPLSYEIESFDSDRLSSLGVNIIRVPEGLSLGESILYSWNASATHYESLTLLHGDTLFLNANYTGSNQISVHPNRGFYKRASPGFHSTVLGEVYSGWSSGCEEVVSGFFRFDKPLTLMKCMVEAKGDFIQGLVSYNKVRPMSVCYGGEWLDFGHINSFFQSRTLMTTQRAFNELEMSLRTVLKESKIKSKKIYAEGLWFSNLPPALRLYTPALLDFDQGGQLFEGARYKLEYLYLLPLSDFYVFSRLDPLSWKVIVKSIADMLVDFSAHRPSNAEKPELSDLDSLYSTKTMARLNEFYEQSGVDINTRCYALSDGSLLSLVDLAEETACYIHPAKDDDVCFVHGDLCFSNILFDSRTEAVKCIDPRGIMPSGHVGSYGDRRYDLAKLYHSIVGLYDFIVAGRFSTQDLSGGNKWLEIATDSDLSDCVASDFKEYVLDRFGYSEVEILAITIHLFLSMLPLHADRPSRQKAFVVNAFRLYERLKEIRL